MKTIQKRFGETLKFDTKKELREKLENCQNGQWLFSFSIYNGTENIGKTADGQYCKYAHGINWEDQAISIGTLEGSVNSLWKCNGHIFWSELGIEI